MNSIVKSLFLFVFAALSIGLTYPSPKDSENSDKIPLTKFVIGRWQRIFSEQINNETEQSFFQLEFSDSGTMVLNSKTEGTVNLYNISLQYYFYTDNLIRVHGRMIDELQIAQDGEYLAIHSKGSLIPDGRYKRVPIIQWPAIATIIGITCVLALVGLIHKFRNKKPVAISTGKTPWLRYGFRIFLTLIALGVGIMIGGIVSRYWVHLLIRLPWDALIMIELSVLLSIGGVRLATAYQTVDKVSPNTSHGFWHYLGIIFMGAGLVGIALATIQIITFVFLGTYV